MVTEQAYQPGVNKNARLWLTPEDVAAVAWRAAHQHRLHWLMSREVRMLARLVAIVPRFGRAIMARYSRHPVGAAR